jgi:hypothetical protein
MDSVFALTLYKQMMNQWTAKRESSAEWQSNAPLILRWLQSLFASLCVFRIQPIAYFS